MAENPISKDDIIDGAGVSDSIKKIIDLLNGELSDALKNVTKVAGEYKAAMAAANATTQAGQQSITDSSKKTQELSETKRVLLKMEKDLEKATATYNALRTMEGKAMAETTREVKKMTKELQSQKKEVKVVEGSYRQLAEKLKNLKQQWRDASEEGRRGLTPQIKKLDTEVKKLDRTIGQHQRNVGNYRSAIGGMGKTLLAATGIFTGVTAAAGALFGVLKNGFKTTFDFEKAMSDVRAISGATGDDFKSLRDNAIALGGSTKFTAVEVAGLQKEYAKLGFATDQILEITSATLSLASATGSSLAESASVAGSVLRAFQLDATQMGMVVDVMAASFTQSALDMNKFATAMQTAGPVAAATGRSIQRTSAELSVLANAGLDASVSGTSLRNIYLELEQKGLSFEEAMQMINSTSNKASLSLDLFGKRGAVAGLVLAANVEEADRFTESYDNAAGSAEKMAEVMEDNVRGSMTKFSSAWEGLVLRTNESEGAIKGFLDTMTTLVQAINTKGKPAIDSLFESRQIETFGDKFKYASEQGVGFANALVIAMFGSKKEMQAINDEVSKFGEEQKALKDAENAERLKAEAEQKRIRDAEVAAMEQQVAAEEKIRDDAQKAQDDRIKAATAAREATSKAQAKELTDYYKTIDDITVGAAQTTSDQLVAIKKQEVVQTQAAIDAKAEYEKQSFKDIFEDNKEAIAANLQVLSDMTNALGDIFSAQKQRELNAAGDNAQKREEIERKYFKKEQTLAVGQAIINGALAVTKATAQTGILAPLVIPTIIAATAAQVGLILSQKFAEGGFTGRGTYRDETGERVAGIVHENEFVIDKKNTQKYRPLIEAIHNDDPARIAELVANSNMHQVWGDMNKSMAGMTRQDPYTRLMYEVLKANVVSYIDSDGNTVLMQNGRKQVIKRKE